MQYAVIFDMDGVLIDSYRAHMESWVIAFRELSVEYSEADFASEFGRTSRDILLHRLGDSKLDFDLSDERFREIDDRKETLYRDIIRKNYPTMDGAAELVESLHEAGIAMAVGSSGPPENIELSLGLLPNGHYLSAVVTRADVTRGKPDPQVFLLAAEKLDIPPERCVVIEDAVAGIEAANRAGMTSIALTGTATREQLADAQLVVNSLRELNAERIIKACERKRRCAMMTEPNSPDVCKLYDEADALKEQGKLDEAVAKLRETLAVDESYALAHSALGVLLQKLGQNEEAIQHVQRVCELEPNDPFSYTSMSVICQRVFASTQNAEYIRLAEEAMERSRQLGQG